MPTVTTPLEQRLYAALKRITKYDSPERLRRHCDKDFGLNYDEALEFAYDNIQGEARQAIHGVRVKREPKVRVPAEPPAQETT